MTEDSPADALHDLHTVLHNAFPEMKKTKTFTRKPWQYRIFTEYFLFKEGGWVLKPLYVAILFQTNWGIKLCSLDQRTVDSTELMNGEDPTLFGPLEVLFIEFRHMNLLVTCCPLVSTLLWSEVVSLDWVDLMTCLWCARAIIPKRLSTKALLSPVCLQLCSWRLFLVGGVSHWTQTHQFVIMIVLLLKLTFWCSHLQIQHDGKESGSHSRKAW